MTQTLGAFFLKSWVFLRKNWIAIIFLCVAISMWLAILFFGHRSHYVDEQWHRKQVRWFLEGRYEILENLTTIPGYHAAMAVMAEVSGRGSLKSIRLNSFLFSLLSIWVFYLLAKKLRAKDPVVKTLQFVFLPISFIYFPMIYTDIFSLVFVLLAFYFAIGKKYNLSAIVFFLSLLIRQTNIVWVAFTWSYLYISEYGYLVSLERLLRHSRRTIGFMFTFLAFILFVWFNNGIAIGDIEHNSVVFHMGNLYYFLAMAGVLFFPILVFIFFKSKKSMVNRRLAITVGISMVISGSFLLWLPTTHFYNSLSNYLRNDILQFAYHQHSWAYAGAIFLGCFAIMFMKFERAPWTLFPFIVLSLVPTSLIEQRYAIPAAVFLLLLRQEVSRRAEFFLMLYFFSLSAVLTYMLIATGLFF